MKPNAEVQLECQFSILEHVQVLQHAYVSHNMIPSMAQEEMRCIASTWV